MDASWEFVPRRRCVWTCGRRVGLRMLLPATKKKIARKRLCNSAWKLTPLYGVRIDW